MIEKRLAILHAPSVKGVGQNVFGATVANHDLFSALIRHGGLSQVDFVSPNPLTADDVVKHLLGGTAPQAKIGVSNVLNQSALRGAGTLLKSGPRLDELAWLRRRASMDRAYSLMGLIHTIAPLPMRQDIAGTTIAPVYPWDALICTSPSVKRSLERMLDDWVDHLVDRLGAVHVPRPQLPLIPLGVNADKFAAAADRPAERRSMRQMLHCDGADLLVLWVGRLSFFEKAFPQPMIRAISEAAEATGKRLHFAMVGWFPDPVSGERMYREAAEAYGPNIVFHRLDGNDRDLVGRMWAASDIFVSLVDNIQETFGITPIEAMAAGLPVVVSDWDGYRYTVQDGVEGMLIPTLVGAEAAIPLEVVAGHALGVKTYQQYVGIIAQHTAVDVGQAAGALTALIQSPELRQRMGHAGRRRVAEMFDWSVVVPHYVELAEELGHIRNASNDPSFRTPRHPAKGDPFRDFADFATTALTASTVLSLRAGADVADLDRAQALSLDMFAAQWRATMAESRQLLEMLKPSPRDVASILSEFPFSRRRRIQLSLLWLCKIGVLSWR